MSSSKSKPSDDAATAEQVEFDRFKFATIDKIEEEITSTQDRLIDVQDTATSTDTTAPDAEQRLGEDIDQLIKWQYDVRRW